ncbi:MAG: glycoside hydrolase family 3 C-terminal domain-containing protein [Lachnospiraceae bacterium]|nr:glycoside hydrolase family 3 C-terminal domain-containing protein [Robinsoniella sp.]MDY3766597.1 glycoside hydrolase family 3 C-terminal domain-containing protein [Lachnospiraceae bacterium]
MERWTRMFYQPSLPLGADGTRVTGSKEHIALSRKAATEGMVLLKNEGEVLPFSKGQKVAIFGKGSIDYVKGGGGSGDVTVAYIRNLYEGMKIKEAEGKVEVFDPLAEYYRQEMKAQYERGTAPGMTVEPEIPECLMAQAKAFTDTAIISICRFSGEGWDRKSVVTEGAVFWEQEDEFARLSAKIFEDGDFCLTNAEKNMVEMVKQNFSHVAVVLNVGGMVDTSWFKEEEKISSVLLAWQGGMEGGLAAADLLCGDANPSGKLTDTFAQKLEDYPSSDSFHESREYVDYSEDIYVGYRYFETLPGKKDKVNYPFGFGLSYTEFEMAPIKMEQKKDQIRIFVKVTNIGKYAGKEVVQVYFKAPDGKLGKPSRVLVAFQKTRLLQSGESQTVVLSFAIASMASFDDLGKICPSAYVLEAGTYEFYVGNCVRTAEKMEQTYEQTQDGVTEQLSKKMAPYQLKKRLLSDGTYEELPLRDLKITHEMEPQTLEELEGMTPAVRARASYRAWMPTENHHTLSEVAEGKMTLDEFMDQLCDRQLVELLGGQPNTGVANTFGMGNVPEYGVPNVMTADGPAGLRIAPECHVFTTAWPCATLLACTWNTQLVEEVGAAGAEEVKENNIGIWLTPAMNIHRSPLCGRNFEYYSEDPLVAGKMGAAMVRGIQSQHIAASVKHFACNNKETNRKNSDSRVSERALREIYLKGFEIVVKEADPWTIMSSYNLINGHRASENREMLTDILRGEWGYRGIVTTDWWTCGEHYRETKAGNDIKMGCGYPDRVMEALEKGWITREEIRVCAKRILEMILKLD